MSEWVEFERRLSELPQFDANVAVLKRIYVSGAVECDFDKVGRLLIPAGLRKHAGLKKEALWAGLGPHIEIWEPSVFENLRQDVLGDEARRLEVARSLAELGL